MLFNLISQQPVVDKIYLYAKATQQAKYQFLIHKQESTGSKHFNFSKDFIKYSSDRINKNIDKCNPNKERRILIVFGWYDCWYA